jgi:hypothetical protein
MKHDNDEIDVEKADLKRKNSSPNILIGTARRVILILCLVFPVKVRQNHSWTYI